MKPGERVLTALSMEEADSVPFQATFCPEFAARLAGVFGIRLEHVHDPHNAGWNGYELEKAGSQDALQCGIGWFANYYLDR